MKILPIAGAFTLAAALGCASIARADEDPSSARAFMVQTASVPTAHVAHTRNRAVRSKVNIRAPMDIRSAPHIVAEAKRYIGSRNPTGFRGPWCGAFAALVARKTGRRVPAGHLQARAWANAGPRLSGPRVGAWAVKRNHVSLVVAVLGNGRFVSISGNNGKGRVGFSTYSTRGHIAFVQA